MKLRLLWVTLIAVVVLWPATAVAAVGGDSPRGRDRALALAVSAVALAGAAAWWSTSAGREGREAERGVGRFRASRSGHPPPL